MLSEQELWERARDAGEAAEGKPKNSLEAIASNKALWEWYQGIDRLRRAKAETEAQDD